MLNLGPTELLLIAAIVATWVIPVWAIVDAARHPEADFAAIGASKTTQLVVLALSAIVCGPIGTIISAIYLLTTRRQLRAVAPIGARDHGVDHQGHG